MSRASEVLRERANDRVGADPDELRAIADLLDACIDDDGHGLTCVICGGWRYGSATAEHLPGCKRAAAERVIARERE